MTDLNHFFSFGHICLNAVKSKIPETLQETGNAVDAPVVPLCVQFRRTNEKFVHSQGIAAVVTHKIVRRYHISLGFTHLDTVLSGDHTLIEQLDKGLVKIDDADIAEELGVESGIQKMKHRMLHAADIHIHRQIFVRLFSGNKFLIILIIYIAQEIP